MIDKNGKLTRSFGQGLLIAIISIGLIHNYLFLYQNIGLNYLLFFILLTAFVLQLSLAHSKQLSRLSIGIAALGVVFASFVMVNASSVLLFFNIAASLALLALIVISVLPDNLKKTSFLRLSIEFMLLPLYSLVAFFQYRLYDRKKRHEYALSEKTKAVLRGVVITIPIALIFTALFASADSVFADLFSFHLPSFSISGELVLRLFILGLTVAALLGLTKHVLFAKADKLMSTELRTPKKALTETTVLLTALNIIFLVFIIVQIVYLFGGRQVVLDNGLTFAEYARRGFFELVFVAGLAHLVIAFTDRMLSSEKNRFGKLLQLGLTAQVFVVIASALRRLKLYQDAFGFTTTRFYAYVVMFCIAAAFVALIWKIIAAKSAAWLTPRYGAIILTALFTLNMIVPDNFVANQNINRYQKSGKIDLIYLNSLSEDAADHKLRAAKMNITTDEELDIDMCLSFSLNHNASTEDDWRSLNIARQHQKALSENPNCEIKNGSGGIIVD